MSREQYAVWCPDLGEAEGDDESLIKAYDAEEAARLFVERSYHEEAFDSPMAVQTRGPYGERLAFSVHPEPTTVFYSYKAEVE